MDISKYTLEDLLLAAIKSEVEAEKVYSKLAESVKNAFLKERLKFLASEENKHKRYIEGIFRKQFGEQEIILPEKTDVPLPEIEIIDENESISLILESAIKAEKAAKEFYEALSERFDDIEIKNMLKVLAKMEDGHYTILEQELGNVKAFEEYDMVWPLINTGP